MRGGFSLDVWASGWIQEKLQEEPRTWNSVTQSPESDPAAGCGLLQGLPGPISLLPKLIKALPLEVYRVLLFFVGHATQHPGT